MKTLIIIALLSYILYRWGKLFTVRHRRGAWRVVVDTSLKVRLGRVRRLTYRDAVECAKYHNENIK